MDVTIFMPQQIVMVLVVPVIFAVKSRSRRLATPGLAAVAASDSTGTASASTVRPGATASGNPAGRPNI